MMYYGIKLVWAGWNNDTVIGFSERGYKTWGDDIIPGTRMLLYETSKKRPGTTTRGTKSIIGEIEVTGTFEDGEKLRAPTIQHFRLVPTRVLRSRRRNKSIPLSRVRELIGDEGWPRQGETWKPLDRETYDLLCAELEK